MHDRHTLIVMRHAKAGELPGGPDFERALRPRGQRDSAAAGRFLTANRFLPELVLCSAARRTRQTWQHLSAALPGGGGGSTQFSAEPGLYQADSEDVLAAVKAAGGDAGTVLYIGHNPAAADLVGLLTGAEPAAFPTAAIAVISVAGPWADLVPGSGELIAEWTPADEGRSG